MPEGDKVLRTLEVGNILFNWFSKVAWELMLLWNWYARGFGAARGRRRLQVLAVIPDIFSILTQQILLAWSSQFNLWLRICMCLVYGVTRARSARGLASLGSLLGLFSLSYSSRCL